MSTYSLKKLLPVLLLLLFTSCDYYYDYNFKVKNATDTSLVVKLETFRLDTTYIIVSGNTETIFVDNHGPEGRGVPFFHDVSDFITSMNVSKDITDSKRDYRSNGAWQFTKDNGTYFTTITNEEFN